MVDVPAANKKLSETEFFFHLMEKHFDHYEFQYFLSAFLSALLSCIEHNRLQSSDPRFQDWYRAVKAGPMADEGLKQLTGFRNLEVHQIGTRSSQRVGMSFPDGIESTSFTFELDFRSGPPVGRYKTEEMDSFVQHPLESKWVWRSKGEDIDVTDICKKGLVIVRDIVRSRDEMKFSD